MAGSEIFPYIYNSDEPGTKTAVPRVDTAPDGVENPTQLADWLGFVEPAPPGEDRVSSPDQKSFHKCSNPTNQGCKTVPPRVETAPHGVAIPTPQADC